MTTASELVGGVVQRRPIWLHFVCIAISAYYALLMAGPSLNIWTSSNFGLVFNSMLANMLHGRFDVDPALIENEGFLVGGRTYAYFGVFPALARLPFVVLPGWEKVNFSQLSMIVAYGLTATLILRLLWDLYQAAGALVESRFRFLVLGAAITLAGPILPFLKPSIYQETASWAFLFAIWFVCLALRAFLIERQPSVSTMCYLGLAAGLCLLTRVSTGLGVYVALGLVLLAVLFRLPLIKGKISLVTAALFPAALFIMLTGAVNFARWGNPFIFAPYQNYLWQIAKNFSSPQYTEGQFNLNRLGCNVVYYLAPVFGFTDSSGEQLLRASCYPKWEVAEVPPGSFLLSDPVVLCFAAMSIGFFVRCRNGPEFWPLLAVATGLAVPVMLMLTAVAVTFRYRMEFYPLFVFLACVGAFSSVRSAVGATPQPRFSVTRLGSLAVLGASILIAHGTLVLYRISYWGTLEETYVSYYTPRLPQVSNLLRKLGM